MKKISPLLILLLTISTISFGQTTKKEMLTKKWKVTGLEEFGTKYDIGDDRKGDWLELKKDGTFTGVIYKGHVEGKWGVSGKFVRIAVSKEKSKTKINWIKVKTATKDQLIFTYQDGDLIQSTLTFSPY